MPSCARSPRSPREREARAGWDRRICTITPCRPICAGQSATTNSPAWASLTSVYTLALEGAIEDAEKGAAPALQIRSWVSRLELRFAKTIPYAWKK